MWNRGGIRSSALERAMAQLSGHRLTKSGSKTLIQDRQRFDLNDLSSEDVESEEKSIVKVTNSDEPSDTTSGGVSKFLKKTPQHVSSSKQSLGQSQTRTLPHESHYSPSRISQSATLDRVALIEERIRNRKMGRDNQGLMSASNLHVPPEETVVSVQSSSDLSEKGSRFLKKKSAPIPQEPKIPVSVPHSSPKAAPRKAVRKGVSLDSDEEDMKRLLGESLDKSDDSPHQLDRHESIEPTVKSARKSSQKVPIAPVLPPKRPTSSSTVRFRRSPAYSGRTASATPSLSPTPPPARSPVRSVAPGARFARPSVSSPSLHSEVQSLEELFPEADVSSSERSGASDDFKVNIMSLDDLAPVSLGVRQKRKEKAETRAVIVRENSLLSEEAIPREEISQEDKPSPDEDPGEYESDFESELPSESASSVSEFSEHLTDGDRTVSEGHKARDEVSRSSRSHSERSCSERTQTRSPDYSESWARSGRSAASSSRSSFRSSSSSSSNVTVTRSEPQARSARRSVKEVAVQTQPEGLKYAWSEGMAALGPSLGMAYVDPTPVASHVISAEAVEALSAYSPAVLALNDMLRQQLALSRSLMENSRHLHRTLLRSLGPPDYKYTTLRDTKEFIRNHRPPKLSMEEALQEVLQEMREYHYI